MMGKTAPALLLLLLIVQNFPAYNSDHQELQYPMRVSSADIWSERDGGGPNTTCGYVKVGENVTFLFRVSSPMYVRIVIVKPDGSEVEVMKSSQVFPEVVYKFYQLFLEPGMRVIKLIGGASGNVLDYCTLHVVTSFAGGDVWTDAGGRGYGVHGGYFTVGTPFGVWLRLNVTAEAKLVLLDPRNRESSIFSGSLDGEKSRRIVLELEEVGNYTLKLLHGNRVLDYCYISVIKPIERYPPSIKISSISLNGSKVSIYGEAVPGTPGEELEVLWDWGDGRTEVGPFPKSHTYGESGVYTIRITARQPDGLSANFTYTILIPPGEVRVATTRAAEGVTPPVGNRTEERTSTTEREGVQVGREVLAFILGALISALAFLIASRLLRGPA